MYTITTGVFIHTIQDLSIFITDVLYTDLSIDILQDQQLISVWCMIGLIEGFITLYAIPITDPIDLIREGHMLG